MKTLLLSTALLLYSSFLYCQESYNYKSKNQITDTTVINKNALYPTIGIGIIAAIFNINYERTLSINKKESIFLTQFRISGGRYEYWGGRDIFGIISLNFLAGNQRNRFFEFGIGLTGLYSRQDYKSALSNAQFLNNSRAANISKFEYFRISPSGLIGYRKMNPEGGIIFRTGIGWPELVYFSFGFNF